MGNQKKRDKESFNNATRERCFNNASRERRDSINNERRRRESSASHRSLLNQNCNNEIVNSRTGRHDNEQYYENSTAEHMWECDAYNRDTILYDNNRDSYNIALRNNETNEQRTGPFRVGSLPAMLPIVTSESETMKLCVPPEGKLLTTSESAHSLVPMVPFLDPEVAHSFLEGSSSTNSLLPRDDSQVPIHPVVGEVDGRGVGDGSPEDEESALSIALQVFIPFLIAGFGMVGAGLVFDQVQYWGVFVNVTDIVILVPSLLGLKGNLEMTLASRLSTQANLGHMDTSADQLSLIGGNLVLTQCQATVVGFLASVTAIFMGSLSEGSFKIGHALIVCTSSMTTASVASLFLGIVMVAVVLISRRFNINPDNVATPIAASLGDLTTLAILAGVASLFYNSSDKILWIGPLVILLFLSLIPLWVILAKRNKFTEEALKTGWTPVISAMVISSIGGFILDLALVRFGDIAVFQPVVNGVGGNLVAIQVSRISTSLHRECECGVLPPSNPSVCVNPCSTFFGKGIHARCVRVLMLMVIPGHLIFIYTISYATGYHLSALFVVIYLLVAVIQVALLMYLAAILVHWVWKLRLDPDNSTIPYLTALGDLLGIGLLTLAFWFLHAVHQSAAEE